MLYTVRYNELLPSLHPWPASCSGSGAQPKLSWEPWTHSLRRLPQVATMDQVTIRLHQRKFLPKSHIWLMVGVSSYARLFCRPASSLTIISRSLSGPCHVSVCTGELKTAVTVFFRLVLRNGSHCSPVAYLQEAGQQVAPISQGKELQKDMSLNGFPLRSHNNK